MANTEEKRAYRGHLRYLNNAKITFKNMASLSPSKPSMIHVFLTSKEAYMMAGGRSSVSSRVATSTSPAKKSNTHRSSSDEMKREMIMAKR